jgi:NADH:ubiquinone oxidoreductase subunit H
LCNVNVILFLGGWWSFPDLKYFFPFLNQEFFLSDLQMRDSNIYVNYSIISTIIYLIKFQIILFFFIWVRATIPRYRYDQLMRLGWKVFVPLTLGLYILFLGQMSLFGSYPPIDGFIS